MKKYAIAFLAVLLGAGVCFADTPEPSKFYKLEFVVKEVDGTKVLNSRTYTTLASDGPGCSIRTNSRVQVPTAGPPGSFQMVNVGLNLDCSNVREVQDGLSLRVTADLTTVPPESTSGGAAIIRENRWASTLLVPLHKATVIFSSDDMTSKHQMQLELTATPIR